MAPLDWQGWHVLPGSGWIEGMAMAMALGNVAVLASAQTELRPRWGEAQPIDLPEPTAPVEVLPGSLKDIERFEVIES